MPVDYMFCRYPLTGIYFSLFSTYIKNIQTLLKICVQVLNLYYVCIDTSHTTT